MLLVGDYIPKNKQVELPAEFTGQTVLANLEAPIVSGKLPSPQLKAGPNLYSKSLGIEQSTNRPAVRFLFTLANNHMMDYGVAGLTKTIEHLQGLKACATQEGPVVAWGGAGRTVEEARSPIVIREAGKRIGIICCREPQFGSAGELTSGCADYGYWVFDAVRFLKSGCTPVDYVIVSCHAALEHSPFPSPRLREYYHRLICAGADVIHGHHAHVPQGWEEFHGGLIFYGLGNFVVDPAAWEGGNPNYLWSNVIELVFGDNGISHKVTPYAVCEKNGIIVPQVVMNGDELFGGTLGRYCLQYSHLACEALKDDATLIGYWQTACAILFDRLYGMPLHCPGFGRHLLTLRNRARYVIDSLIDLWAAFCGRKRISSATRARAANFYNCFLCDSHVDAITAACEVELKNAVDRKRSQMIHDCEFMNVNIV